MTNQDVVFADGEGNKWFKRNQDILKTKADYFDWPIYCVLRLGSGKKIGSICELGCANGWRLNKLRELFLSECVFYGTDISEQAIEEGHRMYPDLNLSVSSLAKTDLNRQFDLVIVSFVLHWVSRSTLLESITAIDRHVTDGGFLIVNDFLPDFPQKRKYHHLENGEVYTYKQDYTMPFLSLNTYKEVARFTFDHDNIQDKVTCYVDSPIRSVCSLLAKFSEKYYPCVS